MDELFAAPGGLGQPLNVAIVCQLAWNAGNAAGYNSFFAAARLVGKLKNTHIRSITMNLEP